MRSGVAFVSVGVENRLYLAFDVVVVFGSASFVLPIQSILGVHLLMDIVTRPRCQDVTPVLEVVLTTLLANECGFMGIYR